MAFVARLGLSLSRTRWSLLHHTPNAHVHCPSSQQGSSIPIGRKPSQPPRPSGLLYIVAHLYSSRRGTGTGRTLPPERRTTSLSLSLSFPPHPPRVPSPSVHAPFLFLPVCVSLLAHAHPLLALFLCAHPTPPFFSPLRLCSLATPLLLFGSVSSPRDRESLRGERRGTMKSVEPGIQATLAQTERKRGRERELLARAASRGRGSICIPLSRGSPITLLER